MAACVAGAAVVLGGASPVSAQLPGAGEGTILVRVEVPGGTHETATFGFSSNLVEAPDGRFDLTVEQGRPAGASFTRPAGTWKLTEDRFPADWMQTSLNCRSAGGSSIAVVGPSATVRLAPGDTVTCTYVNVKSRGARAPMPMIRLGTIFDGFPMFTSTILAPELALSRTHVGVPMRAAMFAAGATVGLWWVTARQRENERERARLRATRSRSGAGAASGR